MLMFQWASLVLYSRNGIDLTRVLQSYHAPKLSPKLGIATTINRLKSISKFPTSPKLSAIQLSPTEINLKTFQTKLIFKF